MLKWPSWLAAATIELHSASLTAAFVEGAAGLAAAAGEAAAPGETAGAVDGEAAGAAVGLAAAVGDAGADGEQAEMRVAVPPRPIICSMCRRVMGVALRVRIQGYPPMAS